MAKILVLVALGLYLVFALVILRQVYVMTKVVSGELDQAIKIAAWVHLIISFLIIFLALVIL